jgi:putative ABC transport system permease protein
MDAINPQPGFSERQARRAIAGFGLTLRLAWRDLSAGTRGFGIFLACLAIGTFAIAGVGSLARGLQEGLAAQGRVIIGGDVSFALLQREAKPTERAAIEKLGKVAPIATLRAMARAPDGDAALVEIKAVDLDYPTLGHLETDGGAPIADLLAPQGGA